MPAAQRLSWLLLTQGPAREQDSCGLRAALFTRAAAREKGSALEKRQDPRGALPFFSPAAF
ncbi:hypothetical protein D3Z39_15555 [Anaerotruncus colihominis]|uniref:Uncharacterized protein n=1 Tax=Anaerotruncus colihominis TaxID=169435 RepID=A0A845RRK1_9FIRM|nr:hypothetical protein [Anaerotruncus colihominis]